jgi:hypothetical protein
MLFKNPLFIALKRKPIIMNITGKATRRIKDISHPLKNAKKKPAKLVAKVNCT